MIITDIEATLTCLAAPLASRSSLLVSWCGVKVAPNISTGCAHSTTLVYLPIMSKANSGHYFYRCERHVCVGPSELLEIVSAVDYQFCYSRCFDETQNGSQTVLLNCSPTVIQNGLWDCSCDALKIHCWQRGALKRHHFPQLSANTYDLWIHVIGSWREFMTRPSLFLAGPNKKHPMHAVASQTHK